MKKLLFLASVLFLAGCSDSTPTVVQDNTPTSSTGPVQVLEFFDFGCGYCRKNAAVAEALQAANPGTIKVTKKYFPLRPETFYAAEAAECAREQGYWQAYHDKIFESFGDYSEETLLAHAKGIGLDMELFGTCLDSGVMKDRVKQDEQEGKRRGITGTPTYILDDTVVLSGAYPQSVLQKLVDDLLEKRSSGSAKK